MISKTLYVGSIPMRWQESGEGAVVVMIHGIPTSPDLWRHVIPILRGVRCLAWEMVGYGRSIEAGRGRDISVAAQADYLIRWLDAMDIRRAVLVGHDIGGGVAQIAAVRHPERVQGLVLMNAVSYDSWPVPSARILQVLNPLVARMPPAFVFLVHAVLYIRGHDDYKKARQALDTHWPKYAVPGGSAALARQVNSLHVQDTVEVAGELSRLDIPARLVWGAADQFQNVAYAERLARDLNAPLDRIAGGKHFVPEDHPDRVAGGILALVDQIRAEGNLQGENRAAGTDRSR